MKRSDRVLVVWYGYLPWLRSPLSSSSRVYTLQSWPSFKNKKKGKRIHTHPYKRARLPWGSTILKTAICLEASSSYCVFVFYICVQLWFNFSSSSNWRRSQGLNWNMGPFISSYEWQREREIISWFQSYDSVDRNMNGNSTEVPFIYRVLAGRFCQLWTITTTSSYRSLIFRKLTIGNQKNIDRFNFENAH